MNNRYSEYARLNLSEINKTVLKKWDAEEERRLQNR